MAPGNLIAILLSFMIFNGMFAFEKIPLNSDKIDKSIVNKVVERSIDIGTQVVKISLKILLENTRRQEITTYVFFCEEEAERISYVSAQDALKNELEMFELSDRINNYTMYLISFPASSSNQVLYINMMLTKKLAPFPYTILQTESQLVRYHGKLYFFSPAYRTINQKTSVTLDSKNLEFYTQSKPFTLSEGTITYGPYENIPSTLDEDLIIHYENNSPFLIITRLERTIEISHWGIIAVEEKIDILHSGATLRGSFSRYDFQKDSRVGQPAVKSYKTLLPASAFGIYYRDSNGNISTSNMKVFKDSVELDLRPRFPLLGGWKTHYTLGYSVPTYEYLFNNGNDFLLKMRVIDHVFDDMVVDEAIIKIILPERCSNIKLSTPYNVTRLLDSVEHTYLDTVGRSVVSFTRKNLVELHIKDFNLKYNFSIFSMFYEPLIIISFLFLTFAIIIFVTRLDFRLTKDRDCYFRKE